MEESKLRFGVTVFAVIAFGFLATSMVYIAVRPLHRCETENRLNFRSKEDWDLHDRLEVPEHNVLVVRTVLSERCYVVPKQKLDGMEKDNGHPLTVIREPLSVEMLEHVAGAEAVQFCGTFPAYQATTLKSNDRARRQAAAATTAAAAPAAAATQAAPAAAAPAGNRPLRVINNVPNDCQDNVLIMCPETVQETCTSGPGTVELGGGLYKMTIKCVEPTKFTATLVSRCKEANDTKDDRFIKCASKFMLRAQAALHKLNEEREKAGFRG